MKTYNKSILAILLAVFVAESSFSQEKSNNGKNPESIRAIDESNILWKTRLWRRMDMNEKQNQPFFSAGNELSKFIVEWVQSGVLQAYANDSLKTKLSIAQFNKNMEMDLENNSQLSEAEIAAGFGNATPAAGGGDTGWGDEPAKLASTNGAAAQVSNGIYYFPKQLNIIEIKEDVIFDKQRSRLYYDLLSLTICVPASQTAGGFVKNVGSFKFKDLDKLFRSNPDCIWYNSHNEAQHKNMADAFDLRLFFARLIKKGNANDKYLEDIYQGEKQGLLMSQQLEHTIMEMEHNLWEY